jgi:hypothetical protein
LNSYNLYSNDSDHIRVHINICIGFKFKKLQLVRLMIVRPKKIQFENNDYFLLKFSESKLIFKKICLLNLSHHNLVLENDDI